MKIIRSFKRTTRTLNGSIATGFNNTSGVRYEVNSMNDKQKVRIEF